MMQPQPGEVQPGALSLGEGDESIEALVSDGEKADAVAAALSADGTRLTMAEEKGKNGETVYVLEGEANDAVAAAENTIRGRLSKPGLGSTLPEDKVQ